MNCTTFVASQSFLLFSIFISGVQGLRDVHISIPVAVKLSQPAILYCEYELENDTLYSVKWYKNHREFFRFTPRDVPAMKFFPVQGVAQSNLLMEYSNATQLHFMKTTLSMSGQYGCEVTTSWPAVVTSVASGYMEVIDPPDGRPTLSGLKPRYNLGDIIHVNCTSPGSRPAVNLTWVLNGKTAPRKHVRMYREFTDSDLIVSISTIKLHAKGFHFPNGHLKLKCTASLHNLYWQTTEKSAQLNRRKEGTNKFDHNDIDVYNNRPNPTFDVNLREEDKNLVPWNGQMFGSSSPPTYMFPDYGTDVKQSSSSGFSSIWFANKLLLLMSIIRCLFKKLY